MEYVWLTIALVAVLFLLRKIIKDGLIGSLDARSERIRQELADAQKLREEANAMLNEQKQALEDAKTKSEEIIKAAQDDVARLKTRLADEAKTAIERRKQQAEDRIAQAEAKATADIRASMSRLAVDAARDLARDGAAKGNMMTKAMDEVRSALN